MKIKLLPSIISLCLLGALHAAPVPASEIDSLPVLKADTAWIFNPGSEFPPGGLGSFTLTLVDGKPAGVLIYDFTKGGAYVGARTYLQIPEGFAELRFKARGGELLRISIRIQDSTEQLHQTYLEYDELGEWQTFRIDLTRPASESFGGANDRFIHYPIQSIEIDIVNRDLKRSGRMEFSAFGLTK